MKAITVTNEMIEQAILQARRKVKNYGGVCAHCGKMVTAGQVQIAFVTADNELTLSQTDKPVVVGTTCRKKVGS